MLPEDVRVWVTERKPKTSSEAGELADDYLQARSTATSSKTDKKDKPPPGKCPKCGQLGHWARYCPNSRVPKREEQIPRKETRPNYLDGVKCYNCNQKGHLAANCPSKSLYCDHVATRTQSEGQKRVHRRGTINGIACSDILVDTGATRTLVRGDLVSDDDILDGEITIRCAHGDIVSYPIAAVKISVGGRQIITQAAVCDTLPASALLGWDIPQLMSLIEEESDTMDAGNEGTVLAVQTRTQRRKVKEQEEAAQRGGQETEPSPFDAPPIATDAEDTRPFNFDVSFFPNPGRPRPTMTRAQKRENRRRYRDLSSQPDSLSPPGSLDISAQGLQALQDDDQTLQRARSVADGEPSTAQGEGFFWRDGLLYRRYSPPRSCQEDSEVVEQLVLPSACRPAVMRLAHDTPMAGHLGKRKTANRILQRFYWPGIFRDVAMHCRACERCQKSSPRQVKKAPLVPLPIMEEPFKRIAMDIVGPLPRSSSGKRYILVICDYAMRYPEAVPLRSIDANNIAAELVKFFARVGVPEEILTDRGANFTSQLLSEVYRLLHTKPIRTTPYHPQTDGLVERFNHTLKAMLKKTATEEGKDWDRLLPYLLFAYREVPQASTGFSPFELLYGRHVRGPLDILKESWESSTKSTESVVSYVLTMRERLAKLSDLVRENLQSAQDVQKRWYDRNAREREFHPGEQVLVLLPTSTNKLLAEWQGPYPVVRRVGRVDYEVRMTDRRKQRRILHVNMLKKWHPPTAVSCLAEEVHVDVDDIMTWKDQGDDPPHLNESLTTTQTQQMEGLLRKFPDVLCSDPGRTAVTEHRIDTGSAVPVRLPPYRLPHAYRDTVLSELKEMEAKGIIERSSSEWAAPIVLVKKKDGTLRMCVDYRRLNAVTPVDAYPMPRIDDLVDRLGKAKYITTLDLSRGYWQVPVSEDSRAKTAFSTPFGLFQFRVMPFGLHGAPATFQRMMDGLLWDVGDYTAAYLDDVVIHSSTWEDHMQHVQAILQKLRDAGLTIKPKKCQFGMTTCTYLGHVVGGGEVRPDDCKLEAVRSFPTPITKRQVRAFLGLTGYYRRFIPSYSETALPLTDLTKKNMPNRIVWSPACDLAFKSLKGNLCATPVLKSPDFDRPFILQTDASDRGVGAVLSQEDSEGTEHPVAYFSRKLLEREERYSTIEKECLAIKLAVHAFRVYLLGRHFTIQTDHQALEWLDRLKDNNARLTRWSLSLQPYHFTVVYRTGKANGNADALSRAYPVRDRTSSSQEKGGGV